MTHSNPPTQLPGCISELSFTETIALYALYKARHQYRPLAPTINCALEIMRPLVDRGILAVPWPNLAWSDNVIGESTTYERLGWRLDWPAITDELLETGLEERLSEFKTDSAPDEMTAELWRSIASAEAIDYLSHQLNESGLPREWCLDSAPVISKLLRHWSITHVRYFVWAGVRAGCTAHLRSRSDERATRDAIVRDLTTRPSRAAAELWQINGFAPTNRFSYSIIGEALARFALPSASTYWTCIPSMDSIFK